MEAIKLNRKISSGQLISVPQRDTIRLLEVYVKRSLSLNDGTLGLKKAKDNEKFVTSRRRQRRPSSDPSLHLIGGLTDDEVGPFLESPANQPETHIEESAKPKKKPKKKKPSFWRRVVSIFYSDNSDEEEESPPAVPEVAPPPEAADSVATALPSTPIASLKKRFRKKKSMRRKFSMRRSSSSKSNKIIQELNSDDITRVECKC